MMKNNCTGNELEDVVIMGINRLKRVIWRLQETGKGD